MHQIRIVLPLVGVLFLFAGIAWYGYVVETKSGEPAFRDSPLGTDKSSNALRNPLTAERHESAELDQPNHSRNQELVSHEVRNILERDGLGQDEKFLLLWKEFEKHAREPEIARYFVDTMQFVKPQDKQLVVELIEASLHAGSYDDALKRSLVNLLSSQYERDASIAPTAEWQLLANPLVLASLRRAAISADHAVAHQAILQFSRLGDTGESIALLRAAKSDGTISTSEYVKEISFHLPLIKDLAEQRHLLVTVENSDIPKYELAENMATMAQLPHALASLSPETRRSLHRILDTSPPAFSTDPAELDVLALARYNHWAKASSLIASSLTGEPVPSLLATLVMRPDADPRSLIAVAATPMSDSVIDVLIRRGHAEDVRRRLEQFQLASLNNAEASGIVAEIQSRLTDRTDSRRH